MNYFILTQGVKSSDYNLIIKNGIILNTEDEQRRAILNLINKTESNGSLLLTEKSEFVIYKHWENILIIFKSMNTDRVNRIVPIYLLIHNYIEADFKKYNISEILSILENEDIEINKQTFNNLKVILPKSLNKYYRNKKKLILILSVFIIFGVFLTLKYWLKWI